MRRVSLLVICLLVATIFTGCKASNLEDNFNININANAPTQQSLKVGVISNFAHLDHVLADNIRMFDTEHSDIEVEFLNSDRHFQDLSPWLLGLEGPGTPPDLVETTYNQMLDMYYHGKIESVQLTDPDLQDLVLTAPDGAIIGLKTRVDPLIVFYHQEIFDQLGLEYPSADWDWAKLDHVIGTLKTAGHKVHIMLTPFTLEWVTMSRYGGRVSDLQNLKFGGYMDSEETVQAAEWLTWVGTKREDYELDSQTYPNAMPQVLINGEVALAIDYAHGIGGYGYEYILERNDQLKIAPLPGGHETVNPGLTMGFSILSSSVNKDAAMKLLRYLSNDPEAYMQNIALYGLQAEQRGVQAYKDIPADRLMMIVQEIKRSVPASLFLQDIGGFGVNYHSPAYHPLFKEMIDGRPVGEALKIYAEYLDELFRMFREEPDAYGECIKTYRGCFYEY